MASEVEIGVEEFDEIFDEGKEDVMRFLDLEKAVVTHPENSGK
jgi:hypothetical protein